MVLCLLFGSVACRINPVLFGRVVDPLIQTHCIGKDIQMVTNESSELQMQPYFLYHGEGVVQSIPPEGSEKCYGDVRQYSIMHSRHTLNANCTKYTYICIWKDSQSNNQHNIQQNEIMICWIPNMIMCLFSLQDIVKYVQCSTDQYVPKYSYSYFSILAIPLQ